MSSSENILQSVKTAIQDVVAPDVRELKAKVDALDKRIASVESNLRDQIGAVERHLTEQNRFLLDTLLAAIRQSKAETELLVYKGDAALAERVTALEIKVSQYMESKAA